jgi:hypothetical protein
VDATEPAKPVQTQIPTAESDDAMSYFEKLANS